MEERVHSFIADLKVERGLGESTLSAYLRDLNQFLAFIHERGIKEFTDINRTHILLYFGELRERGKAAATVTRAAVSLRAFFRYLQRERLVDQDPFLKVDIPKTERKQSEPLTLEEMARLLDQPDPSTPLGIRDKAMLELLYATGIRVSEMIQLNEVDLDLRFRFVRCATPAGKERIVPFGEITSSWLQHYLEVGRPQLSKDMSDPSLFLNRLGERISRQGFWKIVKKYGDDAGIAAEITPHTLRHSFAAHMLANGADLKSVQELMGHTALASTQAYVQKADKTLKTVYDQYHPRAQMTDSHPES